MKKVSFHSRLDLLRRMVDRRLAALVKKGKPEDLREACRYVLSGGGKRIRGVLVLLSCETVGASPGKALDAAAAVEVLHNFTLVHDDVMDNSSLRRGKPTVHVRWNVNTALLAGDVLLGVGYRTLLRGDPRRTGMLAQAFTTCLLDVCEGQALDLEFETRNDVTVAEYFHMIGKKTASLLAAAAEIGGIIGGATTREQGALRRFGWHLGRAFQLQDDLLDVVADPGNLGKPIGGDILARKRTFLLLRSYERTTGDEREFLKRILHSNGTTGPAALNGEPGFDDASAGPRLIERVAALYQQTGVLEETQEEIHRNTSHALRYLNTLRAGRSRDMLGWLAESLTKRRS